MGKKGLCYDILRIKQWYLDGECMQQHRFVELCFSSMVQAGLASADADCLYVRLYVDGALKGQMVQGVSYVNDEGNDAQITGGKTADLSGPIRLCSRSDDKKISLTTLVVVLHTSVCSLPSTALQGLNLH